MTCILELPVYDKGTSLEFVIRDCGGTPDEETGELPLVDLTNASSLTVVFRKPDDEETVIERDGVIYVGGENGDGTDGIVQYITLGDEIDTIGTWQAEAVVDFANFTPPGSYQSTIIDIPVVATLRHPAE